MNDKEIAREAVRSIARICKMRPHSWEASAMDIILFAICQARTVAPISVVAGVEEKEEEIARKLSKEIERTEPWIGISPETRALRHKTILTAIRKVKSLSEPKERKLRIDDVPGGYNLMLGDEKLLHSIHDNLLPQMQRLVQVFSEPKEL